MDHCNNNIMEYLNNDVIICILEKLEYVDALNYLITCKKFISVQSQRFFIEKKNIFYDPNENFETINHGYYIDISINQVNVAYTFTTHQSSIYVYEKFIDSIGYPDIMMPFIFPAFLFKKIKFRFKNLNMNGFNYKTMNGVLESLLVPSFDHHNPYEYTYEYLIDQIKNIYYALKYFRNEIIEAINNNNDKIISIK